MQAFQGKSCNQSSKAYICRDGDAFMTRKFLQDHEKAKEMKGLIAARDLDWHPPPLTPDYRSSTLRSPSRARLNFNPTETEMTGPTFGHNVLNELDDNLILNYSSSGKAAIGPRIIVHGKLMDEDRRPIPGKLIEVWQANAGGRYRHKKDAYSAPLDPNFGAAGAVSQVRMAATSSEQFSPALIPGQMVAITGVQRISTFRFLVMVLLSV